MTAKNEKLVNSERARAEMHRIVDELYDQHRHVTFSWHTGTQRTMTQNAALHLWLEWLSEALNGAGLDMRQTLKADVDMPWSKHTAKEYLWRPIQEALINKRSSAEAEKPDYAEVQEVLCKHLAERFGLRCPPWPRRRDDSG